MWASSGGMNRSSSTQYGPLQNTDPQCTRYCNTYKHQNDHRTVVGGDDQHKFCALLLEGGRKRRQQMCLFGMIWVHEMASF
jgi:hypothetical protein